MTLTEQPLPIQFVGGVETKADPKTVPTTRLTDLQNAVFTRDTTLSKRNGYRGLSRIIDGDEGDYGTPDGLAKRGDELIAFSNGRAYSRRPSADRWSEIGEVSSVIAECTPIARTGTVQVIPDVAIRNGIMVVAWEDSRGGVWCSVLEEETLRILKSQTQLDASGVTPRCVYVDEVIHVIWTRPSEGRIFLTVVNTAAPAAALTTKTLTSDLLTTTPTYDVESCGPGFRPGQEPALIAWMAAGGGWRVGYIHASGVLGSPVTGLPSVATYFEDADGPIAVTPDRHGMGSVAIMTTAVLDIRVRFVDSGDLTSTLRSAVVGDHITSPQRLTCCFGRVDSLANPEALLFWAIQIGAGRTDQSIVRSGKVLQSDPALDAANTELRGHTMLSRAFYDGPELRPAGDVVPTGDVYVMTCNAVRLFPWVGCLRISADAGVTGSGAVCVARLLPGEAPATHFRRVAPAPDGFESIMHLSSVVDRGRARTDTLSRRHAIPLSYRIQLDSANGDQFAEVGIKYTTLDFDHPSSYQTAELGRGMYLASAGPQHYDGDRFVEAGIHCAPDWGFEPDGTAFPPTDVFSVQPGGAVTDGTHMYKAWYEYIDGQGELHRGPVSAGVLVAVFPGNQLVRFLVPTYKLTGMGQVRIKIARSITGATGEDESIALFEVTSLDPAQSTGSNRFLVNDPTVDFLTFEDAISDEDLLQRVPCYTNGGVASNDPAPWAGDVIAVGKNRLFFTDPSDSTLVRFTKSVNDDTALEAPIGFSLRVDQQGGKIRGIFAMDQAMYVGTETAIHVFGGPGPEDAPSFSPDVNTFTPPELVTTDVGIENPTSIGPTPVGTILKTTKGVVLLGRDRQISPIGDPVFAYNDQRVTRTTLLPDRTQIVMLTDAGRTLLFDYRRAQWSTFTNHEGHDAVVVDGVYYYLRTDGRVFQETPGEFSDDGVHIPMLIETAHIKMAGFLQGLQTILWAYFLGTFKSPHTLRMRFRIDYSNNWSKPIDMDVNSNHAPTPYGAGPYGAGPYGGVTNNTGSVYQRRVHLNQTCQSIQFQIQDVELVDDYGPSFELTELLLIGGVVGVKNPLGAARSS